MVKDMLLLVLALPLLVSSAETKPIKEFLPLDCEDIFNNGSIHNGVYTIYPAGPGKAVQVYCDMGCDENETHKDRRWTVIQRRIDGSVNFYRRWLEYKNGFGRPDGEYWLGLENMFLLTYVNKYELRVDLEDFEGGSAYTQYTSFSIDPETSNYKLRISGYVNGGGGDCLMFNNGRDFSTFDKDYAGCADTYSGGFWYNWSPCHYANPNGQYKWKVSGSSYAGVLWQCWKGYGYSLKSIAMKIRRLSLDEVNG
ncbi:microfibril-associated glycoprotein 4-like [Salminus brasiliensis]|uniref:microfibril-associated glycoprotein 4-like n=1 Tax=Salminus brasiliensis TaxID=930266 RepID=UPI003B830DC1